MADTDHLEVSIGELIGHVREKLELPNLLPADTDQLVFVNSQCCIFEANVEGGNYEDASTSLLKSVERTVTSEELDSEDDLAKRNYLLDKRATHILVRIDTEDADKIIAKLSVYYFYVELDNVGPILEGDIVLQGTCIDKHLAPAYCTIEYADQESGPFSEMAVVGPWKMIVPQPEDDSSEDKDLKFTIPISVPEALSKSGGFVRARVYLDQFNSIPFEGETESFVMSAGPEREKRICAVSVVSAIPAPGNYGELDEGGYLNRASADGGPEVDENDVGASADANSAVSEAAAIEAAEQAAEERMMKEYEDVAASGSVLGTEEALEGGVKKPDIINEIRIAMDFDDVVQYQSYGFELLCTQVLASGPLADQDQLWKFYIMGSFGPSEQGGVEDVQWLKTLKSVGTLPSLPMFSIFHDHDLSEPDDEFSVYLAVKTGSHPKFIRMEMLSGLIDEQSVYDEYIAQSRAEYRAAPPEIARQVAGPCGLLLTRESSGKIEGGSLAELSMGVSVEGLVNRDGSPMHPHRGEDDTDEDDDFEDDENDAIQTLIKQGEEMTIEKNSLHQTNLDLQKKAVALIAREKMIMGLTSGGSRVGTGVDAAQITVTEVVTVPDSAAELTTAEQSLEKEKQYQDILQQIVDERAKLNKQQREFDRLAVDLQTRLDDKEFKANGIASSFKQFKKEILSKAENSRTGQLVPKPQIKQFELVELKREEDLERVRLRNISLRTMFRKLERQLRSREQLAEGLHMIDFEQLKIENQTLNEKIEERNEDLAKLKRKKTTTVQVLTHVREKLRFVELANEVVQTDLAKLETDITGQRNTVALRKLDRDSMRADGKDLKAKQGFSNSSLLLVDYEKRKTKNEELKASISELKNRYSILMMQVMKASTSQSGVGGMSL